MNAGAGSCCMYLCIACVCFYCVVYASIFMSDCCAKIKIRET